MQSHTRTPTSGRIHAIAAAIALSLFPSAALAQLPAIIVSQPYPQTVNASQDAAFTVNAQNILIGMTEEESNGRYRIRYRWQRLAAGSGTAYDLTESGTYNGTRSATLTVKNVTSAMNGDRFQCVVSNGVDPERTSSQVELTVAGIPVPTITSPETASATVGTSFSYTITAGNSPSSYGATGLPGGLSVNSTTGVIAGTPTQPGAATINLSATNTGGTGTATLSLTVVPALVAPTITSPTSASSTVGTVFNYQITASNNPTSFGASGLPAGLSINTSAGLISGTPTVAGTSSISLSATNAGGTGTATLNLTVSPTPVAPAVSASASASGTVGTSFSFQINASNNPTSFNATGLPNGLSVNRTTGLISGTPTQAGTFQVTLSATNAVGTGESTLTLVVSAVPVITSAPAAGATVGSNFTYSIFATNEPTRFGASGLPGGLSVNTTTGWIVGAPTQAGTFSVNLSATNAGGTGTRVLTLTVQPSSVTVAASAARLVNLSVRTTAGAGDQSLIVGFVISSSSSSTKPMLVRGIGPTLASFGVAGALADPQLALYGSGANALLTTNDNWGSALNASQISQAASTLGAFGLSSTSRDAALYAGLPLGSYSAQVLSSSGSGIALVELYDGDRNVPARLINISARSQVGTGANILIAGFVIQGSGTKTVLLRAVGPGLAAFGVQGALADPTLSVFSGSTLVSSNDDWGSGTSAAEVAQASVTAGAFALANGSKDAAMLVTLPAGAYTAQVSGVGGGTGVALFEAYESTALSEAMPTVTTDTPQVQSATTVRLGGNVVSPGIATVTDRGSVYSLTNQTPAIGGAGVIRVSEGSGAGSFGSLQTLAAGTYYTRAYATNSSGTAYGEVRSFTVVAQADVALTAGTAVTGISGSTGSSNYYRIDVPAGVTQLTITTTGGTGDANLYVRRGSRATTSAFDQSGVTSSANETVTINNPTSGTYYILLYGNTAYSGVSLRAAVTGTQADDHGNTRATATAVNLNTSTNGVINYGGDLDYFRVTMSASGTLTVYTTGSSDTVGRLLDANGVELAFNDDYTDLNFRISRSVSAGTYYVEVQHFSSSGTGAYVLRVESGAPAATDAGGSAATATVVSLNSTTNESINPSGDVDYFRFEIPTSGGSLAVFTTGTTDTVGSLRNSNDVELASNDDANDVNFRITSTNVSAGVYYIRVTGYSIATGNYSLRVEWTPPATVTGDAGPTAATATDVNLNSTTAASLSPSGDVDYYRFVVPSSGGTLTLYTTGPTDTMGSLRNSSDAELAFNDDSTDLNFRITQTNVAAGTYYIRVTGFGGATGNYTLFVNWAAGSTTTTDDHGNTTATATAVSLNSTTNGAINTPGDIDFFRIQVLGSGTLTVYTTGSTDTYGSLLDANGTVLTSNDDYLDLNFRISRAVTAGTYFISVRHFSSSSTGAYALRVEFATSGSTTPTTDPSTDIALTSGTSVTGISGAQGSSLYYRIDVPTGASQLLVTTTGGSGDVDLLVRRGSRPTTSAYDQVSASVTPNESITFNNPSSGTYYIMLYGYTAYSGVSLRATVSTGGSSGGTTTTDDHGNTTATATAISLNSSTNGAINTPGDIDYFRIEVTASGTLTIYTTGSTDTYGRLLDASGTELASNDDFTDLNFRITRAVTAGTYYISVRHFSSSSTGAYVLRVDFTASTTPSSTDAGGTAATATAINLNSTTSESLSPSGDIDYFRFDVTTGGGTLTIYTTGSTDTMGSLRNSSDVELAFNDDSTDLNFRIVQTNVAAGRYYIRVTGFGGATGAYVLHVEYR